MSPAEQVCVQCHELFINTNRRVNHCPACRAYWKEHHARMVFQKTVKAVAEKAWQAESATKPGWTKTAAFQAQQERTYEQSFPRVSAKA